MCWLIHLLKRRSRQGRLRSSVELQGELNQAIRDGDGWAVRSSLGRGATLHGCTLDADGYHTPLELAVAHGQEQVVQTIRAVAEEMSRRPEMANTFRLTGNSSRHNRTGPIHNHNTGGVMRTKPSVDLNIRNNSNPQPSVEVDRGSIPDELSFPDILCDVMAECAAKDASLAATAYTYFGPSVNFHEVTDSVFIAVIGGDRVLQSIHAAFAGISGVRVRFSDYIRTAEARPQVHIEDATVWLPDEPGTWYAVDSTKCAGAKADDDATDPRWELDAFFGEPDEEIDDDLGEEEDSRLGEKAVAAKALRVRAARSDASIGSIIRTIERIFDLPEGSVALCGPDRKAIRRDARVATLRKRWE